MERDRWILASASPRRRELLERAGQVFAVEPSGVDEAGRSTGEPPEAYALRLAASKGEEVARRVRGRWVLAADTIVVVDDDVLGKPRDRCEARAMLARLGGRSHRVVTAFVLIRPDERVASSEAVVTAVAFRELSAEEITVYVATGEADDKAGAYAIQGDAAAFIRRVDGSHSNVVGLPLDEVERALRAAGLWRAPRGEMARA